ncbi:MAG: transcription antitermination factor NusB [Desulfobacterota bacterium]|nr:transcription antitermination factor NusB [Thermodesulfobacteriota bacterium]
MSRRKSRECAVQILYQIEMTGNNPDLALQFFWDNYPQRETDKEFTERLVKGALKHKKKIDACIKKTAVNWSLKRLTPVDVSILRMAVFELLFCPDIPYKVTLNEAIELGKKFGSEKSAPFINGVLDHIFKHNPDHKKHPPEQPIALCSHKQDTPRSNGAL